MASYINTLTNTVYRISVFLYLHYYGCFLKLQVQYTYFVKGSLHFHPLSIHMLYLCHTRATFYDLYTSN